MAKALQFPIKEKLEKLQQLKRQSPVHIRPRIQMLILLKQEKSLSKIALSERLGVDPNSIQSWRMQYRKEGIGKLLADNRGGNRKSRIDAKTHQTIRKRLSNPKGALKSYKELCQWVEDRFGLKVPYSTLNGYVKRTMGAGLKVARKSHVRKDEQAVKVFKKTGEGFRTY